LAVSTTVSIPYGNAAVGLEVPSGKLVDCVLPGAAEPPEGPETLVRRALARPVGTPALRQLAGRASSALAEGAPSAVIVVDDPTRCVPSAVLVDEVIQELAAGGLGPDRVVVVVATGLHRPARADELAEILGRWNGLVRIENHDAARPDALREVGVTRLGTEISVNSTFLDADLKILTGDVEFHQFCGYGGGAKSVYPGLADAESIRRNHSRMDLEGTGPGLLDGNPVRDEIEDVARMVGVDFLLTVVLSPRAEIVAAFAGDVGQAFREGCREVDRLYRATLPRPADLAIVSPGGWPRDASLYQAQKAIESGLRVLGPGGRILLFAECREGSGSAEFERWMETATGPGDILRRIQEGFVMGGHKAYQIARAVSRAPVHVFSELPADAVASWFLRPVRGLAEVDELIRASESIVVLPQAPMTLASTLAASAAGSGR
jgi:nickel-dependent lactate racemase